MIARKRSSPRRSRADISLSGQSTGEKKLKTAILDVIFQTRSWAKIKKYR
jgi:hypothetical protein